MKFTTYLRRVDGLRSILPLTSAFEWASPPQTGSARELAVKGSPKSILVRPGTSDLDCVEQVFRFHEYSIPYDISPKVIVDAGANIGSASLYFAGRFPQAKIFAIEPDASNFEMLVKNCVGVENITPINAALWHETTDLYFENPDAEKWAVTVGTAPQGVKVSAISLYDLMARYDIERIDLLKIDVEGAELEIFANNAGGWLDKTDVMAIELHDRFKAGCAAAFYGALQGRPFAQELRGENVFIRLNGQGA